MQEEAFWQAIQEAPEDDAPRLIYADWLEDQGEPAKAARAEFIRVQCERARLPEDADDCRRVLQDREAALWKKHSKSWCAPLKPFSRKFEFRRGFPDQVLVQGSTFLSSADAVLSAAPVFSIRLRNAKEQIEYLARCPALERLISLSLYWNHIGQKRAQAFFASPHLGRLSELDLNDNNILPGGLRALLSAGLPRLTSLNLRANKLGDVGLELLASSSLLGQLRTLRFSKNEVGNAGVTALAGSEQLANLTHLDLSENLDLGDAGVVALACSPHLAGLLRLDLTYTGLSNASALALAQSPSLKSLRELRVCLALSETRDWPGVGRQGKEALLARFGDKVCVFQ
jgi:uncharacterized protein (TIGR02996 family)